MYILHNDASVNSSSVGMQFKGCSMHVMVCKTDMPTETCMYTYNTLSSHPSTHTSVYPCQKLLSQDVVLLARVPEGLTQCSELRVGEGGLAYEGQPLSETGAADGAGAEGSKSRKCSDTCTGGGGRRRGGEGRGEGEGGGEGRGGEGGKERIGFTGIHDQLDENESTHAEHFWQ